MDKKEMRNLPKRDKFDNPDMVNTEKPSLFDMHEDMKTVDAIPIEELNDRLKAEKDIIPTTTTADAERQL
ncbi:hypothetical protein AAGS61_18770 [Lysinibacillus sp. KU-BSD001]|uniref:hypothetical protein n=1 Tax=Lysinibacillus sp. KU-BSD001 TaxID=3141328 RepID=UPI0036EC4D85